MKIGILTMQWANNYGGLLQCYGLSKYLENCGHQVEVVDYWPPYAILKRIKITGRNEAFCKFGDVSDRIKVSKKLTVRNLKRNKYQKLLHLDEFRGELPLSEKTITDLKCLNDALEQYDAIIVGSDQIWNPNITGGRFEDAYFLNFDLNGINKIAYAASTGISLPECYDEDFFKYTQKFNSLSVREESLRKFFVKNGLDVCTVIDPVFLLDREQWVGLSKKGNITINEKYILVYSLERNPELIKTANFLSQKYNFKIVVIGERDLYKNTFGYYSDIDVFTFLKLFREAEFIVTNSFHGTAFSIIFQRNFFTVPHTEKPSRMVDLLERINLSNRLLYKFDQLNNTKLQSIDYSDVSYRVNQFKNQSINFLQKALAKENKKNKSVSSDICSGCTACIDVCPQSAISIDLRNFYKIKIDNDKCISCGLCRKVCPNLTYTHKNSHVIYATKNKSNAIREKSSSGGIFLSIAKCVINKKGTVYGVEYEKDKHVAAFKRATTFEECQRFCRSKYIQADVSDNFKKVANDLTNEKTVLFTGTACQIAGLNNYLALNNIDSHRLLTADIICHGTPSPLVFKKYIAFLEKKYQTSISEFVFRDKKFGWRGHGYTVLLTGGKKIYNDFYALNWSKLFTLSINDCCFKCKFADPQKVSDFSLGDFWGIEKTSCKNMEDKLGVSILCVNSKKADVIFKELQTDFIYQKIDLNDIKKNNPMFRPTFKPKNYNKFWNDFNNLEMDYIINKYCPVEGKKSFFERIKWIILYKIGFKDLIFKYLKS